MAEVLTWYEVYEDSQTSGNLDLDGSIQAIQDSMFERNPWKYGDFLGKLDEVKKALSAKLVPDVEKRIELFKYVYYAMRLIDDVVDGDTQPPLEWDDKKNILNAILSKDTPRTNYSPLYHALRSRIDILSQELWIQEELSEAIQDVIVSMNFDLERILDDNKLRTREELEKNFHKMDITWTIKGTALIFGIDPRSAIDMLEPLWEACRTMYNLRDFNEDIIASLINIPLEDLEIYWITKGDLEYVRSMWKQWDFWELPESIKKWFKNELLKIKDLMEEYQGNKKDKRLKYTDFFAPLLMLWRDGYVMKKRVLPETYEKEVYARLDDILTQVS